MIKFKPSVLSLPRVAYYHYQLSLCIPYPQCYCNTKNSFKYIPPPSAFSLPTLSSTTSYSYTLQGLGWPASGLSLSWTHLMYQLRRPHHKHDEPRRNVSSPTSWLYKWELQTGNLTSRWSTDIQPSTFFTPLAFLYSSLPFFHNSSSTKKLQTLYLKYAHGPTPGQ